MPADSGGKEQLVAMGCSGETSKHPKQKQRKVRSPSRKDPRKAWEASFVIRGSLSSSTLSVIFPTLPPPPTCIRTHFQESFPESWKTSHGYSSALQLPGSPSCLSASCSCDSAQWVLLTLYQQLCVSSVLACLAAVGALVLRSDAMDD